MKPSFEEMSKKVFPEVWGEVLDTTTMPGVFVRSEGLMRPSDVLRMISLHPDVLSAIFNIPDMPHLDWRSPGDKPKVGEYIIFQVKDGFYANRLGLSRVRQTPFGLEFGWPGYVMGLDHITRWAYAYLPPVKQAEEATA